MTYKRERRTPPVIWAVVADRSRGRILSAPWPEGTDWRTVQEIEHEAGALTPGEVNTDRPGSFASAGGGYHSGEDRTDFRHQSAEEFATVLVNLLETARSRNAFGKLALVAPPLFLGVLRKKLPSPVAQMVVLEVDRDYTNADVRDVTRHLQDELATRGAVVGK